ncbi:MULTISPECIES: ABC transporter six-transmembrane domain-containing protein [unclassified Tenacibaculum]|uniref:ABC transporter six-transmembrane domain-containing protein n=1 Tax=unclassified Tenacibaculum TaxID=2635139 RepID=UPI001F240BA9|nr:MULTISPECIES: ABC transporter six-transmembrane domain-containing protein [unclassified Tenacibaculum]MCF2873376.1 ABC transporter six-transmembrane domain-containing protein [Tenacibaculum sp. Cn5-1]MCF2933532.1 ABC transporter six-transmembrane domain-containing protein [Tenacibaculum sp. Cn5-34]MCG7509886.1 ABC transporter six-transmembrane domain-containing protein [Tenacibaculum sp. Cn5-46]
MNDFSIGAIFKKYKWKISFTFLLLILENISKVLQPLVLGIAINDLINGSNKGLWLFTGLYLIGFAIGTIRRYYDTRAYTFIYTNVASEIAETQNKKGIEVSAIAARSALVKELVDFFEHDVTQAFTSAISVVGALIMLAVFDLWIFGGCLLTIIVIILIYTFSTKRIYNYNIGLNDELEHRINVLETRERTGIFNHFKKIAKWLVKMSDLETVNFSIIEIVLFILAIYALYASASAVNATAGGIFSVLTYVLEFSGGVFMLPIIFQQIIRLQEISTRLKNI